MWLTFTELFATASEAQSFQFSDSVFVSFLPTLRQQVDLGKELEHQPEKDGIRRAYMVGHGADKEYQPQSWMHGSQVYMSRTKAEVSPEVMASGEHWEFFAGYEEEEKQVRAMSV